MEHVLLPDLVVVRDDEAGAGQAGSPSALVVGGVEVDQLASFQVGDRHCLSGIATPSAAGAPDLLGGRRVDLRSLAPTALTHDGTVHELWELPPWPVGTRTIAHVLLVTPGGRPLEDSRAVHRLLIQSLRFERDGVPAAPRSMGTFGGHGPVVQYTAEFEGRVDGLRMLVD